MLFPTVEFCVFFVVVLPLSWLLASRPPAWKALVLAASYLFYAAADWHFCFLLGALTVGNQLFAVAISRSAIERRRRRLLIAAVGLDLGVLGTFKYYGFFVAQTSTVLDAVNLGLPLPLMTIALPVGISFITFQAISYVVDVRRDVLAPAQLHDFALYLSFFPHLVAGPIVRASEFLPQLRTPRDPHRVAVGAAVLLIIGGW